MAKKMSTKKKASAAVAGVLAVALAVGGAYAWTDYSQSARNTFKGTVAADVLLHDDFDGENKDVYVENTGNNNVYVRVKFAEYLQIGNNSVLVEFDKDPDDGVTPTDKAQPDDVTTWPVHQFKNVATPTQIDGRDVANNNECGLTTHNYFKWNMTGLQKAYLAGVTEANSNGYGGLSEEAFNALGTDADVTIGDITTQKKLTAAESDIMMLSDWLAADPKPTKACWLLDTDGWAYWSAALAPDTATNLLLDEVVATETAPYDNWVYNIDVQLQAATINEMDYWYLDGIKEVANPDNTVATVSQNGYEFIHEIAGAYINSADGTVMGMDSELYISVANNVYARAIMGDDDTSYKPDEASGYFLAGQDGMIGSDDDNMLSGREGGIKVAANSINIETMTYKIDGADDKYVVSAGIDGKLGTYDDTITSSIDNTLGVYDIDNDATTEDKVTWLYLDGNDVNKMLVVTEYVYDNVKFNGTADDNGYKYENSELDKKMTELVGTFKIDANIVNDVTVPMGVDEHRGNAVYVCTGADCDHSSCSTYAFTTYYTKTDEQGDITSRKFFALSLDELLTAFGDSTDADVRQLRAGRRAYNAAAGSNGEYEGFKDGSNNTYVTTHYWLRSPGYSGTRAAYVGNLGGVSADLSVTNHTLGARPACYLDLAS